MASSLETGSGDNGAQLARKTNGISGLCYNFSVKRKGQEIANTGFHGLFLALRSSALLKLPSSNREGA